MGEHKAWKLTADEKLAAEWLCEGIYGLMMGSSVNSTLAEAGLNALDPPKRIPRLTGRRWNELHSVIIDKVTNTLIGIAGVRSPYGVHLMVKLLSGDKTGPNHVSSMPRKRIRPQRKAKR